MSFLKAKNEYEKERKERERLIVEVALEHPNYSLQDISDTVAFRCGQCDKNTVRRVLNKKGIKRG